VFAGTTEIEHGTFTLTRLVAFQFYGCGEVTTPDGPGLASARLLRRPRDLCLPRDLVDGRADRWAARGELPDSRPGRPGASGDDRGRQGQRCGVNFNKHVTGDNLFVMVP
jgi:hypothetical protein